MKDPKKLIAATLLGAALPGVAHAQSVDAGPAIVEKVEEIIVTARLRNEPLQRVPIAVTAFSEAGLLRQQVDGLKNLNAVVPSLSITQITGGGIAQIYLRGAGQDDSQAASEPPVTIYLDGVPYTKAPGALLDIIEFERVEVLRGPQGTLYGRNSTGGAIKFVTRRPDLDATRFVGDLTVGSFDRIDVRGSLSTPLAPNFAVKVDVISRNEDGYVKDAAAAPGNNRPERYNNTSRQVIRASALYAPSADTSIYTAFDYTNDDAGPQSPVPAISSAPTANLVGGAIVQARPLFGPRLAAPTLFAAQRFKGRGALLDIEHNLGEVTLSAILGYRGFDLFQGIDGDGGPNATSLSQTGATVSRGFGTDFTRDWSNDTFSGELRLGGASPRFDWVAGLFVMHEKNRSSDLFGRYSETAAPRSASLFAFDQKTRSFAVFGEGSYRLTDTLTLSLGARLTEDRKEVARTHTAGLGLPLFSGAAYNAQTKKTWRQFTPRAILNWQITDQAMIYASWSRGFQAGAFQSFPFTATTANEPFEPTRVDSYEAGLKSTFFDRRLTFNITTFRADYKNLPSSIIGTVGAIQVLTNDVRLQGIELELNVQPVQGLTLYAIGGLTDDKFLRSVVVPSAVPGQTENRLKFVPEASARLGATYTADLRGGSKLIFTGNLTHSGDFFMSTVNTPFAFQSAYTLLSGEIGYEAPDARWAVSVGGRNLTDKLYQERASTGGGGSIFFGAPRTWYARLRLRI